MKKRLGVVFIKKHSQTLKKIINFLQLFFQEIVFQTKKRQRESNKL